MGNICITGRANSCQNRIEMYLLGPYKANCVPGTCLASGHPFWAAQHGGGKLAHFLSAAGSWLLEQSFPPPSSSQQLCIAPSERAGESCRDWVKEWEDAPGAGTPQLEVTPNPGPLVQIGGSCLLEAGQEPNEHCHGLAR